MGERQFGAFDLALAGSALQLFRQLNNLRDPRGADRMALAQQPAGSIYGQPPAQFCHTVANQLEP